MFIGIAPHPEISGDRISIEELIRRAVGAVFEAFVAQPEDVKVGFVAAGEFGVGVGSPASVGIVFVPGGAAAAERFHRFVDANARARFIEHDDDHRAALAKQKGLVGRLALVLHEIAVAAGTGPKHRHFVELGTLEDAISLVEWFGSERARLFSTTASASPVDHRAALLRWITKRPGCTATASEVARSGPRKYRGDSEAAELSLRALVKAGLGAWEQRPPSDKGGRPTARFTLAEEYRGDESPAALGDSGGFGFASTHAGESAA
jgi:hypothetical protein